MPTRTKNGYFFESWVDLVVPAEDTDQRRHLWGLRVHIPGMYVGECDRYGGPLAWVHMITRKTT